MRKNKTFIKALPFSSRIMSLMMMVLVAFTACDKNESSEIDPEVDPINSESAILASHRVNTPGGEVFYMGIYSQVPETLDVSNMIELGSGVRISTFGKNPYVWNGNSSTMTKYSVSGDLTVSVSDILSFASTGLSGDFGPPSFFSETQAFFFALPLGKIIEFNPTTMEITETIDVDPLTFDADPDGYHNGWQPYTSEGKVILPIASYPNNLEAFPQNAIVGVFDPATKTISYITDTRMSIGYDVFAISESGEFYYRPIKQSARAEDYSSISGHPTTGGLLKVNADGTFDSDFFVDLKAVLDAHAIMGVVYVFDSKAVVSYLDNDFTPPADIGEWYNVSATESKFALVDLNTLESEDFTAFSDYGTVYYIGEIDGDEYYGSFGGSSDKYFGLKRNSATDFEVVSEAIGGSYRILTELW